MKCETCEFQSDNKKSFTNHLRYGCKVTKKSPLKCKYCGDNMPKRKPSDQGYFCDNSCYGKWRSKNRSGENSKLFKTGESRTRLYAIWHGIKRRCLKPNCKDYKNYGERGISIHNEWINDFLSFKEWAIGSGYKDSLTIERLDVNGNYVPSNCTWIKMSEQSKNRRNVIKKRNSIQSKTG